MHAVQSDTVKASLTLSHRCSGSLSPLSSPSSPVGLGGDRDEGFRGPEGLRAQSPDLVVNHLDEHSVGAEAQDHPSPELRLNREPSPPPMPSTPQKPKRPKYERK